MKDNVMTALTIVGTVLFFGLVNPEIVVSDDTVSVESQSGNEVRKFSDLSEKPLIKIEQLLEKMYSEDENIEYRFRILQFFNREKRETIVQ